MQAISGKRVLVTGASGFIGSHLTRELVNLDCQVSLLLRPSSQTSRLTDVLNRVNVHHADLCDYAALSAAIKQIKPQKVLHLAAYVDVSRDLHIAQDIFAINVNGTINLLRALEGTEYESFVNTGTCEEYGDSEAPFREQQPANPVSPYSASKAAVTLLCSMLHKSRGYPIVTLRPFLAYGPHQNLDRLLPQAVMAALQDQEFKMTLGEQRREVNYVSDIVDGYLKAACSNRVFGEIVNIGNGIPRTVRELVLGIYEAAGSKASPQIGALPYREREVWQLYSDNSKAKQLLDWRPRVTWEEGLERTIAWYRARLNGGGTS